MAKNYYPEEFRRKAVDLYESTPEQTMQEIATDLGIELAWFGPRPVGWCKSGSSCVTEMTDESSCDGQ